MNEHELPDVTTIQPFEPQQLVDFAATNARVGAEQFYDERQYDGEDLTQVILDSDKLHAIAVRIEKQQCRREDADEAYTVSSSEYLNPQSKWAANLVGNAAMVSYYILGKCDLPEARRTAIDIRESLAR
jgi:hypothetical protein